MSNSKSKPLFVFKDFDEEVSEFEKKSKKMQDYKSGSDVEEPKKSKKHVASNDDERVSKKKNKKLKTDYRSDDESDVKESKKSKKKNRVVSDDESDEERVSKKKLKKKSKKAAELDQHSDEKVKPEKPKKKSKKAESSDDEPKPSKSKGNDKYFDTSNLKPMAMKKISANKGADATDQSSLVKTPEHPHPLVYKGTTYYCKQLPKNFQQQWDGIVKMRESEEAPVDIMGASKLDDKNADEKTRRFQTLISIMISTQTSDQQTAKAMNNLKTQKTTKTPGLSVDSMLEIDPNHLYNMIYGCTYNNQKVNYIKETAKILKKDYKGDVPRTKREIMGLPGCGPKIANLAMWCCWGELVGIAIDTHMERIFQRLNWVSNNKRDKMMTELEGWLPQVMWNDINEKIVGFGQTICSQKPAPKCDRCLISSTCDYYRQNF